MALAEKLDNDFKQALRAHDAARLSLLRLVRSAVKNLEIAKQAGASDDDIVEIIQREIKQHRETKDGFAKAGRSDEAAAQEAEIEILKSYLPPALSADELKDVVEQAIEVTGAAGLSDLGKVMGKVMPQVRGRATGDEVGQMVRDLLSKS
jgi:uncharacterized protein